MLSKKAYLAKKAATQKAVIARYGVYNTTTHRLYRAYLAMGGK